MGSGFHVVDAGMVQYLGIYAPGCRFGVFGGWLNMSEISFDAGTGDQRDISVLVMS
ncbi:hypothetical protein L873DRAFT_1821953 [Choiromyces venosus 120613-1]|uniref:Uncharacterized protein n=1 Tax=Choiromyces venosus 120613-1 TaxID=1336337 RepID=A0A3N4J0A0_9PEZI|nr:hypothetical protein L873DRAFT_1821953 [Choiromyces venosus 120613-1]